MQSNELIAQEHQSNSSSNDTSTATKVPTITKLENVVKTENLDDINKIQHSENNNIFHQDTDCTRHFDK